MTFLDLEIFKEGQCFKTRTFFKPTDRNGYIPMDSCHHRSWLCNIPRGQFIRLRRNCSKEEDYFTQSNILAERFRQKGYNTENITKEIHTVGKLDRATLVTDIKKSKEVRQDYEFKMILDFNIQHKKFEKIVMKPLAKLTPLTTLLCVTLLGWYMY